MFDAVAKFVDGPTCSHEKTALIFSSKQYRRQCLNCFEVVTGAIKYDSLSVEEKAGAVDRIAVDYADVNKRKHETRTAIIDYLKGRKDSAFWRDYNEYLLSPEWAALRLKVFARANWKCEGCGDNRATEVHHKTYEHVFHEFMFELLALCHNCHEKITQTGNAISR